MAKPNIPSQPNKHKHTPQMQVNHVQSSTFSGPLPPPDIMDGYNRIVPNAAERIIAVFESEVIHRHELERLQATGDEKDRSRSLLLVFSGQIFGFLLAMAFVASGAFLIFNNKQISGTVISTTAMVGIVAAFLRSNKKK